jgi:hypothetical protein
VYALDHSHTEEEHEPLEEAAQAEEAANAELTDGKPRCIPPIVLGFSLITISMLSICLCIKFVGVD